jgi:hypothetical protein
MTAMRAKVTEYEASTDPAKTQMSLSIQCGKNNEKAAGASMVSYTAALLVLTIIINMI